MKEALIVSIAFVAIQSVLFGGVFMVIICRGIKIKNKKHNKIVGILK